MKIVRLNNRGLQPPQPMIRILRACEDLQVGDRIEAEMDRRPMFLFPELDERGLIYTCVESGDGSFLLSVERTC